MHKHIPNDTIITALLAADGNAKLAALRLGCAVCTIRERAQRCPDVAAALIRTRKVPAKIDRRKVAKAMYETRGDLRQVAERVGLEYRQVQTVVTRTPALRLYHKMLKTGKAL